MDILKRSLREMILFLLRENRKENKLGLKTKIKKLPARIALLFYRKELLIFIFVKHEVFLAWVIGPNVFYTFIHLSFIFQFLKIFYHFNGCSGADGVIN